MAFHHAQAAAAQFEADILAAQTSVEPIVPNGTVPPSSNNIAPTQPVQPVINTVAPTATVAPVVQPIPAVAPVVNPVLQPVVQPYIPPLTPYSDPFAEAAYVQPAPVQQPAPVTHAPNPSFEQMYQEELRRREEAETKLKNIALEREYTQTDLSNLATLPEETARELQERILLPALKLQEQRHQQALAEQRAALEGRVAATEGMLKTTAEAQQRQRNAALNGAIMGQHPDFQEVTSRPEWAAFINSPMPGTLTTYSEQSQRAYATGNAQFINDVVATFKQQLNLQPTLADIAAPATNSGAAGVVVEAPEHEYTQQEYNELWGQRVSGRLSLEDWNEFRKAFEKAEAEGKVVY